MVYWHSTQTAKSKDKTVLEQSTTLQLTQLVELGFNSCIPSSIPGATRLHGYGHRYGLGSFPRFVIHIHIFSINTEHTFPQRQNTETTPSIGHRASTIYMHTPETMLDKLAETLKLQEKGAHNKLQVQSREKNAETGKFIPRQVYLTF